MIEGFATKDGTSRFKEKHEGKSVAQGHFRSVNELYLSSLGMGSYLGEPDSTTDQLVSDAVNLSIESGAINVIDTAINYRSQKSERAIGKALKRSIDQDAIKRDEVFVSTKNGYITNDGDVNMEFWTYIHNTLVRTGLIQADDISSGYHCMKISYLNDQLERSRKNLGLDCIDLMYLHNAVEGQVQDIGMQQFMKNLKEVFEFYEQIRKEGKIRHYGMATWNCFRVPPGNMEYLNIFDVTSLAKEVGGENNGFRYVQLPFNLAMDEALMLKNHKNNGEMLSLIEATARLKLGIFTSVPLLQGRLLHESAVQKFGNIDSVAVRCLQFVRSAGVTPLVGHKRLNHVRENLEVAKIPPFTESEFKELLSKLTKVH
ncbi:MAG: aldo/keto reductase [Nitrososphaerales archaeon]